MRKWTSLCVIAAVVVGSAASLPLLAFILILPQANPLPLVALCLVGQMMAALLCAPNLVAIVARRLCQATRPNHAS